LSSDCSRQKDLSPMINPLITKANRVAFQAITAAARFFRGVVCYDQPLFVRMPPSVSGHCSDTFTPLPKK